MLPKSSPTRVVYSHALSMTRRSPEKLLFRLAKSLAELARTNNSYNLASFTILFARFFSVFKSLAIKTLTTTILCMEDDDWLNNIDNSCCNNSIVIHLDAPAASSSSSSLNYGFFNTNSFFDDEDDNLVEKLYLVSYRWFKEVERGRNKEGVLYNVVSSGDDDEKQIILSLSLKEEEAGEGDDEGFVGQEYALVSGRMWLRALKR